MGMSSHFPSTAYSRDLGDELRRVREASTTLNATAFADKLGWDQSKVSNIETGKARASEIDLAQFFTMCDKDIDFINEFRQRYSRAFDEYLVQVPDNVRTFALAESTATTITSYDVRTMPGLVQTPKYADALFRITGFVPEERIPALVEFRIQRQSVLQRHNRPTCMFYVHDDVLRKQVGSAEIMEEQYYRLLSRAYNVRIVPADAPIASSGCVLWEYEKSRPVAFSETDLAKVFVQDPAAIIRTRLLFDRLDEYALDAEQSRWKLAEYVGQPREVFDDSGPRMA